MAVVEIDPGAGFCFGVEQVIQRVEATLENGEELYGLGAMVHNESEIQRLKGLGLKTVSKEELGRVKPARILFRAHGEPPSTYRLVSGLQIGIIDGTCPIVKRLQKKIRDTYEAMDHNSEQVVIFGKPEHPETIGLLGQVDGDAIVVSGPGDITKVDSSRRVHLFSQTTMDPDQFREVESALSEYLKSSKNPDFQSSCTICGQMKKRKPGLSDFARKHEVIIFVSGRNSSNGKMLFEYCKSVNPETYWISGKDEVNPDWLRRAGSIGISGATSTSRNQLESVMEVVKKLTFS